MAATRLDLTVYYEDGTEVKVVADQRDIVVFERLEKCGFIHAMENMPIILFRFLGYQSLKRTGQLVPPAITYAAWEAIAVAVEPDDDDEEVTADPGRPEASGGSSSTSPTRRAPASGTSRAARTTARKTSQR